jgi:hypothetical protein
MQINLYRCSAASRSVIRATYIESIEVEEFPADMDDLFCECGGEFFEVDDEDHCNWTLPSCR